jgi:catechol 2,3-dioxygenase-like lactoylglutathione lyase family enzyme
MWDAWIVFERFTDDARAVVVEAHSQARAMGQAAIGTEHLLMALAGAHGAISAEVLRDFGVSGDLVREQVIAGRRDTPAGANGREGQWTPTAERLLECAMQQAAERGEDTVTVTHLLSAAALVQDSGSAEILGRLGVDLGQLSQGVDARVARSAQGPGDRPARAVPIRLRLDHVQLAAPAGCEAAARAFYGALLGFREQNKPARLRAQGGVWFAIADQQLHVGVEPAFSPARKAHPAFRCHDSEQLRALADRLDEAGTEVHWDQEIPGVNRFFTSDPWGNRLEFLSGS